MIYSLAQLPLLWLVLASMGRWGKMMA